MEVQVQLPPSPKMAQTYAQIRAELPPPGNLKKVELDTLNIDDHRRSCSGHGEHSGSVLANRMVHYPPKQLNLALTSSYLVTPWLFVCKDDTILQSSRSGTMVII